jgi:hypothetical protein
MMAPEGATMVGAVAGAGAGDVGAGAARALLQRMINSLLSVELKNPLLFAVFFSTTS